MSPPPSSGVRRPDGADFHAGPAAAHSSPLPLSPSSPNRHFSTTSPTMFAKYGATVSVPTAFWNQHRLLKDGNEETKSSNYYNNDKNKDQHEYHNDDAYVDYVPTAIHRSFFKETCVCAALILLFLPPLTWLLRKRNRRKRCKENSKILETGDQDDTYYLQQTDEDNLSDDDVSTSNARQRRLHELAASKYIRMEDLPDVISTLLTEEDQLKRNGRFRNFNFLHKMEGLGALAIVLNQRGRYTKKKQKRSRPIKNPFKKAGTDDDHDENGDGDDGNRNHKGVNRFFLRDNVPTYELAWEDLSRDSKACAIALGYNADRWDSTHLRNASVLPNAHDYPYKKAWKNLTERSQQNATSLGYTAHTWDEEHSRSPFAHVPAKGSFWQAMFSCANKETKKIFQLALPGFVGSASSAVCGAVVSAMISLHLGAANYVAYSMAYIFVGLAQALYGGIPSACTILVAQSIGSGNNVLAGQYEQATFLLVGTVSLPLYAVVYFFFPTLIHLFGLEEDVAERGNELVAWLILAAVVSTTSRIVSDLMWADERGTTMTVLDNVHNALYLGMMCLLILVPQWLRIEQVTLRHVGIAQVISSLLYNVLVYGYVVYKGWLNPYKEGLFYHFSLFNRKLVKSIVTISVPLTLGGIVATCEWEILTLFAAHMGTPEVAAWTILGSIWSLFEYIPMGFLTAAELRVSRHLGQGNPGMAKLAAYKTMLYCMTLTVVVTVPWVVFRDGIIRFYTDVEVIKDILDELVLALGVANFVMVLGVAAYTILCAQNRTKLASGIYALLSFCATLPLSTYFVYYKGYDLYSILFSMIVGYSLSSLLLLLFLLTTNWRRCCQRIINKCDEAAKEHTKVVMNTKYPVLADENAESSDIDARESHHALLPNWISSFIKK